MRGLKVPYFKPYISNPFIMLLILKFQEEFVVKVWIINILDSCLGQFMIYSRMTENNK